MKEKGKEVGEGRWISCSSEPLQHSIDPQHNGGGNQRGVLVADVPDYKCTE